MDKFIKLFGLTPARHNDRYLQYRRLSDIDNQALRATRLMNELGVTYTSVEKQPQIKGFTIYF